MSDPRTIVMSQQELDTILDEAARRGGILALKEVGLNDDNASGDLRDLRALLVSWREVRKSALQAIVKVLTTALLGALLLGIGIQIGGAQLIGK